MQTDLFDQSPQLILLKNLTRDDFESVQFSGTLDDQGFKKRLVRVYVGANIHIPYLVPVRPKTPENTDLNNYIYIGTFDNVVKADRAITKFKLSKATLTSN